jgi:hypothetical protein
MSNLRKHQIGRKRWICAAVLVAATATLTAQSREPVDLDAIYRIKAEGFQGSQIMETLEYLTDVHGPRLTGSPNARAAADYTVEKLREWGMETVRLEEFPFGRGWANARTVALAVSPQAFPIIAYAKAWTPGTSGPVRADAVVAVIRNDADIEEHRGTLGGKAVLTAPTPPVDALFEPPGRRFTDNDLANLALQPDPSGQPRRFGRGDREFTARRMQFFLDEGVAALIEPGSGRGDSGSVRVGSGGSRNPDDPPVAPQLVFATEHYGRIARMLEKEIPVTLELDVQNQFYDDTLDSFNIVAELPGTERADEVVMLGAHFDSWHAGTGATDNASGSAVMLEAIRILAATRLELRRTVRLALWTGEEQGLIGSRAYVREHFGDRDTMVLEPEHAKLSGYFNLDNGTGAIRGVYLQGNEAIAPLFEAWMDPFANLGMTTLAIRNTGGTDHLSFDAVGLPGFQFIQDPVEYGSRTHHSNLDLYERIQPADMMQNAVIVASFVYHAANRDALLPRKPLPEARAGQ